MGAKAEREKSIRESLHRWDPTERIRRVRAKQRSRYARKDHRWKPAWKTDPNRVLGQGPPR